MDLQFLFTRLVDIRLCGNLMITLHCRFLSVLVYKYEVSKVSRHFGLLFKKG